MVKKYCFKKVSKHKFQAKPTVVDGIRFASKKEARRYGELRLMLRAGLIEDLELQQRFALMMPVTYVADFVYFDCKRGEKVIEDTKGYKTAEYKRKKKLMQQQHGITIRET